MQPNHKAKKGQEAVFYSEDYGFLGHLLCSERLLQNIPFNTVARDLNLSTYILRSLESGHFNSTPGLSYMVGFMRTYAAYLGLDGSEMARYIRSPANIFFEEEHVLKVPVQRRQLPSPSVLWGATAALVMLILGYMIFRSDVPTDSPLYLVKLDGDLMEKPLAIAKDNSDILSSVNQFMAIYHKPFTTKTNTLDPANFSICCRNESWMFLKDTKGNVIRQGLLRKGDKIVLPIDFQGILHTGNAGGLVVEYNRHAPVQLGFSGQVIHNFHLNLKKILQNRSNPANN